MSTTAGNLTRDEARQRAAVLSDVAYDVHLDLRGDDRTFRSDTTVRFSCAEPGVETWLDLSARAVDTLVVNGQEVDVADRFDGTRLALPPLEERNEVRVIATCAYQRSGAGMHRAVDPVDGAVYLHTQFEPFDAHLVFACFDQPDLKARTTVSVDAPDDWEVVSNMPVATRDGGSWRFETTPLLSTYLVAVVAGPYVKWEAQHGDVPLGIYCRGSMAEHLDHDEIFTITRQGLDFFAAAFDLPYPFAKYDQLFVPEFNFGAMENPGCITFAEHYIFRGHVTESERESRANTILHEMAHMWFGDLVTMRWWDDLWLNESFATFMAYLASARATRFANAWVTFEDQEKTWARYQDQLPTTHPIEADAHDLDAVHQNFDGITYAKGASVLRQLVAWVGEEPFLAGVRAYFHRYAWGNAELRDLLRELEAASGREDLESWAKTWLQEPGINTLGAVVEERDGAYAAVSIEQTAPDDHPTLRPHRVGIGLFDRRDGRLVRRDGFEIDVAGPTTAVERLTDAPVADLLLVNDGGLTFAKLHLDDRSLTTVEARLGELEDPLARSLSWGAAWEMVRDAAMPPGRYVRMVAANVASEPDVGVLQTILRTALAAVEHYGHPDHAATRLRGLADLARAQLESAQPGSDVQLAWARFWATCARDDEHAAAVRELLDGDLTFDGLAVDTELRWHLVRALAGAGAIGEDVIVAEHGRDPTDLGERHAEAARAARPDADAKARAWQRIVGEPDMSHSLMKAIMGGFMRRDQPALVTPYVEPYFEQLRPVYDQRPLEVALAFATRMYPSVVVEEATLQRTDRELAGDLPGPLRRTLLEQRDSVERALRSRRLDGPSDR